MADQPPTLQELLAHLEAMTQMHVTAEDATQCELWRSRRDKTRVTLLARLARLEDDTARSSTGEKNG